ncbi:uncharacterized protein [Rutidosis leptorrhynchoides]|uniref:uncharacterized protein n=1 Tax=Rutidosis leptorrhynchoides TaxID=125765 RepID=UPI003A99830C
MWFDKWCSIGPIEQIVSRRDRYDFRLKDDMVVAEYRQLYGDSWPDEWRRKYPVLDQIKVPELKNNHDAMWNRLNIQERLLIWNPGASYNCHLCDIEVDSVQHLFFKCDYSKQVWGKLKEKLLFRGLSNELHVIMEMMAIYPYKKQIWSILTRLVIDASVYFVWQERNKRCFQGVKRNSEELITIVQDYIKVKLLTLKVKDSKAVREVEQKWGVNLMKRM